MKIKICGLKRMEDVEYANKCLPDYVGFVFAKSRRQVTPRQAASMKKRLDPRIKTVGVFVNESPEQIRRIVGEGVLDLVQLHGQERAEDILRLKELIELPVIKAVPVVDEKSIRQGEMLPCEYLLLDHGPGGTGQSFSWEILKRVEAEGGLKKPYFLAGGLNAENIREAMGFGAYCLDVSSGAESHGVKNYEKMRTLTEAVRKD